MTRARIRNKNIKLMDKRELIERIENRIYVPELKDIAMLYYVKEYSQLDISFELGKCEKSICVYIKEIQTILE